MANKEAIFTLRVDTGNSVAEVQKFDQAINNLNTDIQQVQDTAGSSKGVDKFETQIKELNERVESGSLTMQELTQALKQYQNIAAQAGAESPVGQEAIEKAAGLKDEIGDLRAATAVLSSDFVGLDTTLAGLELGAQIFGGVESAMALAGVESEALTQTMVKLQAVQGVVNAVTTVANSLQADAILGIQLRNGLEKLGNFIRTGTITGLTAQATAQGAVTVATNATSLAMKALRIALISTGIGAIVVLLVAAADAMGFFGDETAETEKANEKLNKSLERQNEIFELNDAKLKKTADNRKRLLEANGASEEAIHQDNLKRLKEEDNSRIAQMKLIERQLDQRRKMYKRAFDQENWDLAKDIQEKIKADTQKYQALALNNKEYQISVKEENKRFNDEEEKKQKEAADKAKEKAKAAAEKRKEDLKKIREVEKEFTLYQLSDREAEIAKEQEKYNELIKLANKYGYNTTNLRLALKNAINDIEAKYAQQELDLIDKTQKEKRDKELAEFNRKEALRREEIALEEAFFDEYSAALLTQQQAEEVAVTSKYFNLKAQAEKNHLDTKILVEKEEKEIAEIRRKYEAENLQKKIDIGQQILTQISSLNSAIADIENARLQELQNQTDAQLASLNQAQQQELNSSNLTAEQRAAIDKKYASAKYAIELKNFQEVEKIKKQQFERDKALRIAQVAIDTATAIVKGIAQFGPPPSPAGIAAIASAAIIGATQIAAIAAQKYQSGTAPSLNTGGGVTAGATAGELGGAGTNANLNTQQQNTAELIAQTNQGIVYVLESDITGTQNKVAMQNKLSVW